jgi:hypothetical protein
LSLTSRIDLRGLFLAMMKLRWFIPRTVIESASPP